MVSDTQALVVIAVISLVTIALRVIPFFAIGQLSSSAYMKYLGEKMPTGVMILLVAYTVKDEDLTTYPYGLPLLGSLVVAAVMYWKTDNSLLSIGGGLALYMVLVNLVI
ncbi:AzlD domain-containing protein [Streptomyces sp. HNM0574]|uniref:branched-chain amino acid transporter permease n=1 Tax=Streptomyces sp. HNM0574 TaxID=2714954 RepID=UPI00146CE489|nr:AzlD domain-containing protein [Streptomyces sp. HNM0574]NLU67796.1 branched-chain amino acid transporter [Streptomyces sp. HNM0574]